MIRNYKFAIDIDKTLTNESIFMTETLNSNQNILNNIIEKSTVKPGVDILKNKDLDIILVTGRQEKCREATLKWLYKNNIPFNQLFMVPNGYYGKLFDQKLYEQFKLNICIENKIHFVLEDDLNVLKYLKRYGFSVQKVNHRFDTAFKKLIQC